MGKNQRKPGPKQEELKRVIEEYEQSGAAAKCRRKLRKLLKEGEESRNLCLIGAAYYYLAQTDYREGEKTKALSQALKAATILDETSDFELTSASYHLLGLSYVAWGYYQLAITALNRALRLIRNHRECSLKKDTVLMSIAKCYFLRGDCKKSIRVLCDCMEEAKRNAPADPLPLMTYGIGLSECYETVGENEKAGEVLTRLESLLPRVKEKHILCAYYARCACVAYAGGDGKKGKLPAERMEEELAECGDFYELHRDLERLARALIREGEFERAGRIMQLLTDFSERKGDTGDRIIAYRVQAEYYHAKKDNARAVEAYEKLDILYRRLSDEDKEIRRLMQKQTEATNKEVRNLLLRVRMSEEKAVTDPLTGFLNRAGAEERMGEVCREGGGLFMILDLDNFKLVNDLYGHEMGDRVLQVFTDIVRRSCRHGDLLCRIGGDEFLVYFKNATDERATALFSERLNKQLAEKCRELMGDDFNVPIGVSLGGVRIPEQGASYRSLFSSADKALYQVKQNGKHGYQFYGAGMSGEDAKAEDMEQEFAHLLTLCEERGEAHNAMWVGQEAFTWIHRFMDRFALRYHNDLTRLMFSLTDEGQRSREEFLEAVFQFGVILQKLLRKNDVIMQCRPNSFLLLLPELSEKNVPMLAERILAEWEKTSCHEKIEVEYIASSRTDSGRAE